MAKTEVFERYADFYNQWFDKNPNFYQAELEAVRILLPAGKGVEIGVGSGKFAHPLNISIGIEPCETMAQKARALGIEVLNGTAEKLPLKDKSFDFALMVTTICFVDDPIQSIQEAARILKPSGSFLLAFVDKDSPIGKRYLEKKDQSKFYRPAVFYSAKELLNLLKKAGFQHFQTSETLFESNPYQIVMENSAKRIEEKQTEGSFVVIRASFQIAN